MQRDPERAPLVRRVHGEIDRGAHDDAIADVQDPARLLFQDEELVRRHERHRRGRLQARDDRCHR
jgi:hypothetical protein